MPRFYDDVACIFPYPGHSRLLSMSEWLLCHGCPMASLSLSLSCMEHGLRLLYTVLNRTSSQVVLAINTVFYTTLDEILRGSTAAWLGTGICSMMYDILDTGPRLRDRLSHGEASDVGTWGCDVICICAALQHKCRALPSLTLMSITADCCLMIVDQYRSKNHPVAIATKSLAGCWTLINRMWGDHVADPRVTQLLAISASSCSHQHTDSVDCLGYNHGDICRACSVIKCVDILNKPLELITALITGTKRKLLCHLLGSSPCDPCSVSADGALYNILCLSEMILALLQCQMNTDMPDALANKMNLQIIMQCDAIYKVCQEHKFAVLPAILVKKRTYEVLDSIYAKLSSGHV